VAQSVAPSVAPSVANRATPFLVVDVERLTANIGRVARAAADAGVALRPHVKTHKCAEIAAMQVAAGAVGITVATIGEAEVFVDAGFADVFIAYPLWLDEGRATRLAALRERARVAIGVDSAESARHLARVVPGLEVLVEVDSGQHRSGTAPEDAGAVADAAREAGLDVHGVFTFPGHGYAPDGRESAARDEAAALATAAGSLRRAGIEPRVLSGGSTPTLEASLGTGVPTELRPGVYALNDAQQWELASATTEQLAITCHATVVSHAGGRLVLDAGAKSLGADRAPYNTGFGRLLDRPDARVVMLSEHHAVVEGYDDPPPLGDRVRVVPNHVCVAVNLADVLWAAGGTGELEAWPVAARGRNS
jgi:D-serine deaminase-like pyridoxal phosphate-dependent protein